jgi:tetratricopeptide (TPR) repeat protein
MDRATGQGRLPAVLIELPRRILGLARQMVVTLLLVASLPCALAADVRAPITPGEWALLPDWCYDSQAGPYGGPSGGAGLNSSPRASKWVGIMGTDFWNMHHYCYALRDMLRLRIRVMSTADRIYLQGRAINDIGYVIKTCKPTMPLMPEVYLSLGRLYLMTGDLPSASDAFEQSRTIKPDYWPAYEAWIIELTKLRQFKQARELVEAGLKNSPRQPELLALQKSVEAASTSGAHAGGPSAAASKAHTGAAPH